MEEEKKTMDTVGEIAVAAITLFIADCEKIAKENWTEAQVEMLETLFEAAGMGYEYKCVKCEHFGTEADAPETTRKDCMWARHKSTEESPIPPCEEE